MKKIVYAIVVFLIIIIIPYTSYATSEIISSQMESLNISSFIKEGKKYTKDVFPDLDLKENLNSAVQGKIDNKILLKPILKLVGKEIIPTLTLLRKYSNNSCYT